MERRKKSKEIGMDDVEGIRLSPQPFPCVSSSVFFDFGFLFNFYADGAIQCIDRCLSPFLVQDHNESIYPQSVCVCVIWLS